MKGDAFSEPLMSVITTTVTIQTVLKIVGLTNDFRFLALQLRFTLVVAFKIAFQYSGFHLLDFVSLG